VIESPDRPLRLLIVENEVLITVLLHEALREAGLVTVGPAFNLQQAEHLASCCDIDGALLDVYLDSGESTLSIGVLLRQRGIPFMFVTGGTLDDLPGFEGVPVLRKPVSAVEIITAARSRFGHTAWTTPAAPSSSTFAEATKEEVAAAQTPSA
jgi:DNA-binding response OmpR family regulator